MKKILIFILLIFLISVSCKKSNETHVYGKVIDKETEKPLEDVPVILYKLSIGFFGHSSAIIDSIFTDKNGEYNLAVEVEKGSYEIECIHRHYKIERKSVREGYSQKKNFKLSKYKKTIVYGFVSNGQNKKLLEGVKIQMVRIEHEDQILAETTTDSKGFYSTSYLKEFPSDFEYIIATYAGLDTFVLNLVANPNEAINLNIEFNNN